MFSSCLYLTIQMPIPYPFMLRIHGWYLAPMCSLIFFAWGISMYGVYNTLNQEIASDFRRISAYGGYLIMTY